MNNVFPDVVGHQIDEYQKQIDSNQELELKNKLIELTVYLVSSDFHVPHEGYHEQVRAYYFVEAEAQAHLDELNKAEPDPSTCLMGKLYNTITKVTIK